MLRSKELVVLRYHLERRRAPELLLLHELGLAERRDELVMQGVISLWSC